MTPRPTGVKQVGDDQFPEDRFHESRNLDLLRSAAVSFVYIGHLVSFLSLSESNFFSVLARAGVMIFFVHTSLVLMLSMGRMRETGIALWRNFLVRRAFRIYPLSICCVIFVILIRIPFKPFEQYQWPGWNSLVSNLLLIQNITRVRSVIGPLWSLPWEVQMYLALPLLFIGWRMRPWSTLITAWVCSCAVTYVGVLTGIRVTQLFLYFPCFLGGILAFTLARKKVQPYMPAYFWPFMICVICFVFAKFNPTAWTRKVIYPEWLMCAGLGLIIPLFREISAKSMLGIAAAKVAKYSYGIYIFHVPAMWFSLAILKNAPLALRMVCLAVLTIVMPILAYHAIEKPLIQLGKRLTTRGTAFTGAAAASGSEISLIERGS